jgi:hypothetical protein
MRPREVLEAELEALVQLRHRLLVLPSVGQPVGQLLRYRTEAGGELYVNWQALQAEIDKRIDEVGVPLALMLIRTAGEDDDSHDEDEGE